MDKLLRKFEATALFSDAEAWFLFRLAAFAEAIGWSLLIIGILLKRLVLHGSDVPVKITGQFHGTIFLLYLVAAVVLYPSLGWRRWRAVFAVMASVPPYGSLIFEQWVAHHRGNQRARVLLRIRVYEALVGAQA